MAYESDDPNTTSLCLSAPVKGVSTTTTRRTKLCRDRRDRSATTTPRQDRCSTPDNEVHTTPDADGAASQVNEYADSDEDIPCGQLC
jgi:hypothetical protein